MQLQKWISNSEKKNGKIQKRTLKDRVFKIKLQTAKRKLRARLHETRSELKPV